MQFNNYYAFYLFLLFIPLIILYYFYFIKIHKFSNEKSFEMLTLKSNIPSFGMRIFVCIFNLIILSVIILAIAEPMVAVAKINVKYENVRLFFLIDVSKSMSYAEDINPNRLSAIKKDLKDFYKKIDGEYLTSIIPFSGSPNINYCPLTYNKTLINQLIDLLSPETAPANGTDLSFAISSLQKVIVKNNLHKDGLNLIILLSDGGKEESDSTDKIKLFKSINLLTNSKFYVIGVGSDDKTPLIKRGENNGFIDYLRDENNQIYYSSLDENILMEISEKGNGKYIRFIEHGVLYNFLNEIILENRVPISSELMYFYIATQHYFFGLSVCLISFLYFYYLRNK